MNAKKRNPDRPEKDKALPSRPPSTDKGNPGGGKGRVDVTGNINEGVKVDPDLLEGAPGYQESGDSEVMPNERLKPNR